MARRWLRDTILTSEKVDLLDPPAEVFYRRLMSVVDDYGRYDARPVILKVALYPLRSDRIREADISRWIAICVKAGLIVLYEVESKPYLVLLNLCEPRALSSKFPQPPGDVLAKHPTIPIEPPKPGNTCEHLRADVPDAPALRLTPHAIASRPAAAGGGGRKEELRRKLETRP